MLVHADWPRLDPAKLFDEASDREMGWIIRLIEEIRSIRTQLHVPAGARIPILVIELEDHCNERLARNETLLRRLARIERVETAESVPAGSATISVEGGEFCLPLADVIDVVEERARLAKSLERLNGDIAGLQKRLDNPKFVSGAPEHVVEETRSRLEQRRAEAAVLASAAERLTTGD